MKRWLGQQGNVVVEDHRIAPELGWNIKPMLLSALLDRGLPEVVWIDSDVILTRPIREHFAGLDEQSLLVTEEPYFNEVRFLTRRASAWGLTASRDLPHMTNSCVVRVTQAHRGLLAAWQNLLDRPDYKSAQQLPKLERPFHMVGDQDAMAALLGSHDFAHIPVRFLRRDREIAQCLYEDGFGPWGRLRNIRRLPPLVHALGSKPWRGNAHSPLYIEVHPYRYAAEPYRENLSPDERGWLDGRSKRAWLHHCLALGNPSLSGLWPAVGKRVLRVRRGVTRALAGQFGRNLPKLAR
ncbi:hypothetical protein [Rubellimicrobium aerolatum]|uniref:Nucleotide-diphospho-sugar transferase domain-containing protein n=1 Tax=Rubellimicrobium aerolatum TaxID=490979 RepID=A0ABW0SC24_9RHOB|nr:hypothetical protein [Rubellimicrobium aerolatum]MBP1805960.1 hypothetical protein [Rubellimicrobium aerolatum]